jgi:hypothetical protein
VLVESVVSYLAALRVFFQTRGDTALQPDFERHTQAKSRRAAEEFAAGRRFSKILEPAFCGKKKPSFFFAIEGAV